MGSFVLFTIFLLALLVGLQRVFGEQKKRGGCGCGGTCGEGSGCGGKCGGNCTGDCGAKTKTPDAGTPPSQPETADEDSFEDDKKPKPGAESGSDSTFVIKPYLQLGTGFSNFNNSLELVWHAKDEPGVNWGVNVHAKVEEGSTPQVQAMDVANHDIPALNPVAAHKQFRATIADRSHGEQFVYEVSRNGTVVFTAEAAAPKPRGASFRFVAVGDIGEGDAGANKVAYQIAQVDPDFVVVPGDIAYKRGRLSENIERFFPVMNNDETSPEKGAPLMRSRVFVACPGNHDYGRPALTDVPNLDAHPDLFAYFFLWSQPMNGPHVGAARNTQVLYGDEARREAFLKAAAGRYPRMASFSYDYADTHWLFLDANEHMDWTSEDIREWVRHDLASATARWKFVVYHQPAFTSHTRHRIEQRMRLLCDIFQENGVDVVFNGHAHWYERIRPVKFTVRPQLDGRQQGVDGAVTGELQIDRAFDGQFRTRPNGIVYLVTGAGGAKLHPTNVPIGNLEPFTDKLVGDRFSFTVVDVNINSISIRQISEDGDEIDRFTMTK